MSLSILVFNLWKQLGNATPWARVEECVTLPHLPDLDPTPRGPVAFSLLADTSGSMATRASQRLRALALYKELHRLGRDYEPSSVECCSLPWHTDVHPPPLAMTSMES